MIGALASRAASKEATTVEEEVTFYNNFKSVPGAIEVRKWTYNGGDSELVLLGIFEEVQHIIANNNTFLSRQNILDTHVDNWLGGAIGLGLRGDGEDLNMFLKTLRLVIR